MRILVTSGATRESLDGIRYLTNGSTGSTGSVIADYLTQKGQQVTYLYGKGSILPKHPMKLVSFEDFHDLNETLMNLLDSEKFEAVIHLAAVSDYSVSGLRLDGQRLPVDVSQKLPSNRELEVVLRKNFKIVDRIKSYCFGYSPMVVAFKLTHTNDPDIQKKAIEELISREEIDYVVHNDQTEITPENHPFKIFSKKKAIGEGKTKLEMAEQIFEILEGKR